MHGYQANDFGAIVAAAALGHDIGNPPFGHSGEKAIGHYFKTGDGNAAPDQLSAIEYEDLCSFEGNANGFKLMTETIAGAPGGLRISYATLGAYMKYPKSSLPYRPTTLPIKSLDFFNLKAFFEEIAHEMGLGGDGRFHRHPLAYLVKQLMIFVTRSSILKMESIWMDCRGLCLRIPN